MLKKQEIWWNIQIFFNFVCFFVVKKIYYIIKNEKRKRFVNEEREKKWKKNYLLYNWMWRILYLEIVEMTKREYILTFLDKVKDIREPARGFVVLMRHNVLNEEQLDQLFQLFKSIVQSTNDMQKKLKLQQAIARVEKLKSQEQQYESASLDADLDQILNQA